MSNVTSTSSNMRDKDPALWLGHLASPIGCMSSIGVSDPVNVYNGQKNNLIRSQKFRAACS